ncbi:MAG: hypothetical protein U0Q20_00055 [Mycobacterium sp.]|nr:hypothetical protein [Mycobacterium sp.]
MADSVIWIIVAVAVVLAVVAAVFVLRSRRHTRLHGEAQRIRDEVEQHAADLDRRETLARETAARAQVARAEAEAKDAEATRLEQRADVHRSVAAAGRDELDSRLEHADTIDPRVKDTPSGDAPVKPAEPR